MIVRLAGKIIEIDERTAVVDVNGVGYGVLVSSELAGKLVVGEIAELYIYEHLREQEHTLYGFLNRQDKKLFELLLSVNGIGPKAALAIFDLANSDILRTEIASANVNYLTQASGVGKKAAERIIIDLKDKVGSGTGSLGELSSLNQGSDDALDGLMALGYSKDQAHQMLSGVTGATTEDKIKQALRNT